MASVLPRDMFFRFLRSNGSKDMNIDGSVTPVTFSVEHHRAVMDMDIFRVNMVILDAGPAASEFGGIPNGLTNGLLIRVMDSQGNILLDFLDGLTIRNNSDFGLLAGPDWPIVTGAGTDAVSVRWTIAKAGDSVVLNKGDRFEVVVQDDLTSLDSFRIQVQGIFVPKA